MTRRAFPGDRKWLLPMTSNPAVRSMRICLLVAVASLLGSLVMSSSAAADIYWTKPPANFGGSSEIGRADQNGSNAEPDLISLPGEIYGIALDKTYVYWTNYYTEAIGRAKRDG